MLLRVTVALSWVVFVNVKTVSVEQSDNLLVHHWSVAQCLGIQLLLMAFDSKFVNFKNKGLVFAVLKLFQLVIKLLRRYIKLGFTIYK